MPAPLLIALGTVVGGVLAKIFVTVIVGAALWLFWDKVILFLTGGLTWVLSQVNSLLDIAPGQTVEYTELAGWWLSNLRLPEILAVILSATLVRFTLRVIPFIGKAF